MKIAFLIQDLFQQGAQYVTALMIRGFVAKGYDVDLIVSKVHQDLLAQGDIEPFEIPRDANVIILPDRKARNNVKAICDYLVENDTEAIFSKLKFMLENPNLITTACRNLKDYEYDNESAYYEQCKNFRYK